MVDFIICIISFSKKFSKNYQFITKIEKLDFDLHERKF